MKNIQKSLSPLTQEDLDIYKLKSSDFDFTMRKFRLLQENPFYKKKNEAFDKKLFKTEEAVYQTGD
jgi:hypothetical protein